MALSAMRYLRNVLLLLFGLCVKETDKLIKISKNVIQLRITLLNYNGYVIVNFFISKNRNLDTKTIPFIEFVKPSGKKASSHSLSAITRFTLIQKNIGIRKKEFLYNTLYSCFNFRIVRRILLVFIENAEFICFFILPNIIVFYKFYSILNTIIC